MGKTRMIGLPCAEESMTIIMFSRFNTIGKGKVM